jgi:endonuclease YncB( thermonuclease family)
MLALRSFICVSSACLIAFAVAGVPRDTFTILGVLHGPLFVERIIDGDTFVLEGGDRVRIIGVDAPEVGEPAADRATAFLAGLIAARPIYLEFDAGERDRYGRWLAYVYVEDPGGDWVADDDTRFVQVSHALSAAGLADIMTVPPNVAYAEIYLDATRAARDAGLGFWAAWLCIDLNTGSLDQLVEIVHISEQRGAELVAHRPFTGIEQLTRISGISELRLADIIDQGIVCPLE